MVIFMKSKGTKRKIASALAVILEAAKEFSFLGFLIPYVNQAAQLFGILGVVHATVEKNLAKHKLASTSSLLSAFAFAALYVPALAPFLPIVAKLAALFGAASLGASLTEGQEE